MLIEKYEELKFTNSFMFSYIMTHNPDLCKEVVEAILDVRIREIIRIDDESSVNVGAGARGVRLDVYLEGDDSIYDIEMQTQDTGNLEKRARYYQGIIDTDYLEKGKDFNLLKESYVVFICTFDPFENGLRKYTFRNRCEEKSDIVLNDGTVKVFVNTKGVIGEADSRFCELMQYFEEENVSGTLSAKIDARLKEARQNERMRARYMTLEWELASKYREGREEGREEERVEIAKSMQEEGIAPDVISKITGINVLDLKKQGGMKG